MSARRCGRCEYFYQAPNGESQCRFDPPRLTVLMGSVSPLDNAPPKPILLGSWAPTRESEWCGKFKTRVGEVLTMTEREQRENEARGEPAA